MLPILYSFNARMFVSSIINTVQSFGFLFKCRFVMVVSTKWTVRDFYSKNWLLELIESELIRMKAEKKKKMEKKKWNRTKGREKKLIKWKPLASKIIASRMLDTRVCLAWMANTLYDMVDARSIESIALK